MPIKLLLPMYNEAAAIASVLDQLKKHSYDAVVVDDGSTDDGPKIAADKGVAVLSMGSNCGKGAALKRQPAWKYVVIMDSDGQHDVEEIKKFIWAHRETGADIVVGNRMGKRKTMPWVRWITNQVTSWLVSLLAGQRIEDSQCGFRSLSRRVIRNLDLDCRRFDMESEMLIQAGLKGYKIVSVPVRTIYGGHPSRIKPVPDSWRFLRLLVKYGCGLRSAKGSEPAREI